LLKSGSFEGTTAGWNTDVPPGVTFNMVDDNTAVGAPAAAQDGTGYLAVNTTSINGVVGNVYQDVPVPSPTVTSYVATAWLSAQSGTATGRLCVEGLGGGNTITGGNCIPYSVTAGPYTQVQLVYDTPLQIIAVQFVLIPNPGATTDMDTASLMANLLMSGSFESGDPGWQQNPPVGPSPLNMAEICNGRGGAQDGVCYLSVNTSISGGSVYQAVQVQPTAATAYTATAWLSSREPGPTGGKLCIEGLGPNTSNCRPYSVAGGTWTQVQLVYDAPANTTAIQLQIYGSTTSMDTVSLTRSALMSGSFEGTSAGWNTLVPAGASVNMVDYNTAAGAPAAAQDGTWYLAFNSNASGGAVDQDVPVPSPTVTSYVAAAWLSAQSGTASGTLCVEGLGASPGNCRQYNVTAGSYTPVQLVYDAPASITDLRFEVYPTPGGGTTDMDTASLSW
jgi:hypothetical protein